MEATSLDSRGADSSTRPRNQRKASIRQQQERQLYTRKNTSDLPPHTAGSIRSDPDSVLDKDADKSKWLRMSRQPPPSQHTNADDPLPEGNSNSNLDFLISSFDASTVKSELEHDIHSAADSHAQPNGNGHPNGAPHTATGKVKGYRKPWLPRQFLILSRRTWRNLYRNPMLMLTHYAIAILLAVFLGVLFYGLTDDLKGFQNRLGFFFFLLALFAFSTLTSLTTFATERLLFVRERAKGYYSPLAYYLSKVVFDIVPLRLIPPIIMGCVVYPMTGLVPTAPEFFKFMLFLVLFNLAAAMICLFIGICIRNQGVANLLGVLVMLFSLLFGGFLLNHETIPRPVMWLQSVSCFSLSSLCCSMASADPCDCSSPSSITVSRDLLSTRSGICRSLITSTALISKYPARRFCRVSASTSWRCGTMSSALRSSAELF